MKNIASASVSASVLALSVLSSTHAQNTDDSGSPSLDAVLACRSVDNDAERLACLDERLSALSDALQSGELVAIERETPQAAETVAEAVVTAQTQVVRFDPWDRFGFEQPRILPAGDARTRAPVEVSDGVMAEVNDDGRIDTLTGLEVASVDINAPGRAVVLLSNGQMWRQRDTARVPRIRDRDLEEGVTAEIETGFLGGYVMKFTGYRGQFRVERVR
jgi:hypothetical protein